MLFKSLIEKLNSLNSSNVVSICESYTRDTDLYRELTIACSYPEQAINSTKIPIYMKRNIKSLFSVCYTDIEMFYNILIICQIAYISLDEESIEIIKDNFNNKDLKLLIKLLQKQNLKEE